MKMIIRKKRLLYIVVAAVIIATAGIAASLSLSKNNSPVKASGDGKPAAPIVKAKKDINKDFYFKFGNGKPTKQITYSIESAELEDEIIVNGQRLKSVSGKTFLIVDLKITNDTNQGIQINTRDYVRLSVKGKTEEWTAPDIHNDPVEVQAISTKSTRLGFPVSESDKNFILRIGEISGQKTDVEINY
jgi:hypothetical protein